MRDSCGSCGIGETPQTHSVEEAHRPPHGKRASWSSNQPPQHLLLSNKVYEYSHKKEPTKMSVPFFLFMKLRLRSSNQR
ncbi:hypothetical protein FVO58_17495 [Metabacillus halosaccharovorans]|nr:hypothetical protein [Metabacillus halosaccharovorans]